MKRNLKKMVSLTVCAALALSLTACGGTKTEKKAPEPAQTSTTSGEAAEQSGTQATGETTTPVADGKTYDKVNLKMSYSGTDTGMDGIVAVKMKELLEERSGGNVTLSLYGNAQLASGNMQRQVEMMVEGSSFELGIIGEALFSDVDPAFNVSFLPFAFSSYEEAYQIADSTGGEWSNKKMAEYGLKRLDCFSNSMVHITNNKVDIVSPADLKNLKMRTYGDVQMGIMKELGADPINMNWSEVYSAMQMGTIDGHLNGYQTIDSASVYEVQSHLTECNIQWAAYDIIANAEAFEKLSPDTQELIETVARESALYGREYLSNIENDLRKKFEDAGMTLTKLTPEQLNVFKDATSETQKKYMDLCGEEACAAWGLK